MGNALYWIETLGTNDQSQRGKYYRIKTRRKKDKSRYLLKTLVTSQKRTSVMTVGTIKTLHDGGETCPNNVTDCFGVDGGCKHLDSIMICDQTIDCYGGFDEFYCCYNTTNCGIRDIHVNCLRHFRQQQHSIDLYKDVFDWKTHPFSKLVKEESIVSSVCHVVGEYMDKNGKRRQFYINDLRESHILRQFSGKTSVFRQIKFTKYLRLNGSYLRSLETESFISFSMLTGLLIANTPLTNIGDNAFGGLWKLVNLTITENKSLKTISSKAMPELLSLKYLDVSNNHITELKVGTFSGLTSLNSIDLRGNALIIRTNFFQENDALKLIYTDSFIVCCMKPELLTTDNCHASKDAVSGCNDLIEDDVLRIFLWIIGITAALGNITVVVYRFIGSTKSTSETFITFVTNLSVSDAMMGFYMLIIATHDAKFKGQYAWNEYDWKNSFLCELSGTISFVSSESSVLFILFITIDRILAVKYPIGGPKIKMKQAHLMSLLAWVIAFASAFIPGQLFHTFYSYSGVCIALPLTVGYFEGTFYSVAVFLGFNFVIFLVIAFGQLVIFREIKLSSRRVRSNLTSRDRDVATMLLMVVITDCFCWLPIGVLVIMALCGINTPNVIYAWIIVFVMPINSAINPLLYTIVPEIKEWVNRRSLKQRANSREEKSKYVNEKNKKGIMETCV